MSLSMELAIPMTMTLNIGQLIFGQKKKHFNYSDKAFAQRGGNTPKSTSNTNLKIGVTSQANALYIF